MDDQLKAALTELWGSLTDEQKARALACSSPEELLAFLGEEKIELPDELLGEAAGGYLFKGEGMSAFEIINDKTGDVMADGIEDFYAACAKASELGQSVDFLRYSQLEELRKEAQGGC